MRKPSAATQARGLRAEVRRLTEALNESNRRLLEYRGRSSKAEQDVAEWKRRFDALLERTPKEESK